ncbi:MAG: TatD family hydrolase [Propionibacteriaceae bacterium]|nr:TatD family hydrolase [Propionibacteriaceae bacterium]
MVDLESLGLPALPEPLPCPTVDAHTHLDSVAERTGLSAPDSLDLAAQVGIGWVIQAGDSVADSAWGEALARENPQVVACVALHPNVVARLPVAPAADDTQQSDPVGARDNDEVRPDPPFEQVFAQIRQLAQAGPHVRAIGETGLDYYRTTDLEAQDRQRASFARHIQLACELDLTLMIHDRDAHDDVLSILDDSPKPVRVVMHAFSGDSDFAQACIDRGYWLSFPGVTTYKANHHLRRALAVTPPDKILVETDAPYLTPLPHRGRPNAPYLTPYTVRFIAEQKDWDLVRTCVQLRDNAFAAYGGPWGRDG